MISSGELFGFALASFVLIVIPGPGVLFIVGRALAHGRRTAIATAGGHTAGNYVVAACVAVGLGSVLSRSAEAFLAVKLAGAAYLIWLGVQAFRHRGSLAASLSAASDADAGADPGAGAGAVAGALGGAVAGALGGAAFGGAVARADWRALRDGFVVGVTNPKAFILFGAILPQFVNRSAGHVPGQMLLLALVSVSIGLVSDCSWGLAASGVRAWFARSPRRFALVGGAGGLAMIGVGVAVVFTGRSN